MRIESGESLEDGLVRYRIPENLHNGIRNYLEEGLMPGSFLCAVFSNDLYAAMARASNQNLPHIRQLCSFLYNELPGKAIGSREAMQEWCESKSEKRK